MRISYVTNGKITTRAEEYYQRAIEADPKDANNLGNYANFLCDQRQDYDKAEEYYQRAIEADPKDVDWLEIMRISYVTNGRIMTRRRNIINVQLMLIRTRQ